MKKILGYAPYQVMADPKGGPPLRFAQCKECEDRSEVTPSQAETDLWVMNHISRTTHDRYREVASTDLIAKRKRGGDS